MSVYNRKMFANAPGGFKQSSRGVGITSGLVPNKTKRGLVDGPGRYSGDENKIQQEAINEILTNVNLATLQPYKSTFEALFRDAIPEPESSFSRNFPALLDFFQRVSAAGAGGQPLTSQPLPPFLDTLNRISSATPALANIKPAPDIEGQVKSLAAQSTIDLFKDMISAELTKDEKDETKVLGKGDVLVDTAGNTIATGALDYNLKEVDGNLIMTYEDPENPGTIIEKTVFKQLEVDPDDTLIKLRPNEIAYLGGKKFEGKDTGINVIKSSPQQELGFIDENNEYQIIKAATPKEVEKEIVVPKGGVLINKETNDIIFDNSASEVDKKQLIKVPPGTTVIDANGNEIFKAEDQADDYIKVPQNTRLVTPDPENPGQFITVLEAEANTPPEKDRSTETERSIDTAFDGLLNTSKVDNEAVAFIKDNIPGLAPIFDSLDQTVPFNEKDISTLKAAYNVLSLEKDLRTEPTAADLLKIEEGKINLQSMADDVNNLSDSYDAAYDQGFAKIQQIERAIPLIDTAISGSGQPLRQQLATIFDTFPSLQNSPVYSVINKFIGEDTSLANTETLSSFNQLFTLLNAEFFKGNLNQQEIDILRGSVSQLFLSKDGQRLILDIAKNKAELEMKSKELYDNFLNTGELLGLDGEAVFTAKFDENGALSIADKSKAQREIFKIVRQLQDQNKEKFEEQVAKFDTGLKPYTIDGLENLPDNKKIFKSENGVSYNLVKEFKSTDGNFGIVGFSNENGEFIKPDGSVSTITFAPNSPVYGLRLYQPEDLKANNNQIETKIFNLYSFRGQ